ncbi:hypothetical protein, partial [Candidatus Frankia alpina]|uniref:hypothetical protein n=1 Tax=Candidatus Frankia alpina TaxID=2699483 RepID=UPI0013D4530B
GEISRLEVTATSWAGMLAQLVVEEMADGGVVAVLTSLGGESDRTAHLHDVVLEAAAEWLDADGEGVGVVWRWTSDRCAPHSWHCGWGVLGGGHPAPAPVAVAVAVAAWRRRVALVVDWLTHLGGALTAGVVLTGVLMRLAGRAGHGVWEAAWWAATPRHAVMLAAAVALTRQVAGVVGVVLDPADEPRAAGWPACWWDRLGAVVEVTGPAVLLAAAVIALGGGWLA